MGRRRVWWSTYEIESAMGFLIAVVAIWVAYRLGWEVAHRTVAKECEVLGGFYVGDKVYRCVAVEQRERAGEEAGLPAGEQAGGTKPVVEA